MMDNKVTKKYKRRYHFNALMSFLCETLPLVIFVGIGLFNGDVHKGQKVFLGFSVIMASILLTLNMLRKYNLRSPMFIILIGLSYALVNLLPVMLTISFCCIFDEFIFTPLKAKNKELYTINKQIDARTEA